HNIIAFFGQPHVSKYNSKLTHYRHHAMAFLNKHNGHSSLYKRALCLSVDIRMEQILKSRVVESPFVSSESAPLIVLLADTDLDVRANIKSSLLANSVFKLEAFSPSTVLTVDAKQIDAWDCSTIPSSLAVLSIEDLKKDHVATHPATSQTVAPGGPAV